LTVAAVASGCQGWPQVGFGPGKTSFNGSEAVLRADRAGSLTPLWSVDVGGAAKMVAAGGRLHVQTASAFATSAVRTFDAATGEELWSRDVGGDVPAGGYVVVRDRVVHTERIEVGSCSPTDPTCSIVFVQRPLAFDAATGADRQPLVGDSVVLHAPTGDEPFGTRLAVLDGTPGIRRTDLFVTDLTDPTAPATQLAGTGEMLQPSAALDEQRGQAFVGTAPLRAWPTSCPGNVCAATWTFTGSGDLTPPVVDDHGVYTIDADSQVLVALDPATGSPLWSAGVEVPEIAARPAVRNGTVYVSGSHNSLLVFEDCGEANCPPVWTGSGSHTGRAVTPVVARDAVYVIRPAGEHHETLLEVYDANGCGAGQCPPLATRGITGDPVDLLVGDGHVIVHTTSGLHAFGRAPS
jgi:outer membrane protein assembly factor BamB